MIINLRDHLVDVCWNERELTRHELSVVNHFNQHEEAIEEERREKERQVFRVQQQAARTKAREEFWAWKAECDKFLTDSERDADVADLF